MKTDDSKHIVSQPRLQTEQCISFAKYFDKHNRQVCQWEDSCFKTSAQPKAVKHRHNWINRRADTFGFAKVGGLNFTRFADSRKRGGNAVGKGGGGREREWGILTFTYRQRAEQSRAEVKQSELYEQFFLNSWTTTHPSVQIWMGVYIPADCCDWLKAIKSILTFYLLPWFQSTTDFKR